MEDTFCADAYETQKRRQTKTYNFVRYLRKFHLYRNALREVSGLQFVLMDYTEQVHK